MVNINNTPPHQYYNSQRLSNMDVIRPILIVLLVLYHSFAIFGGAWEPIDGFPEIQAYWWLDWLSYAFMLETFVFISGYVFGYQVRTKGKEKLQAKKLFIGKLKRLILPSAIFSLIYILLFGDITQPVVETLYGLINGVAHMWFLPMLFWCFVLIWLIEELKLKPKLVLPTLIVISLFSVDGLPLQFSHTMYYMLFFYAGFALQRYDVEINRYYNLRNSIFSVILFVVLFFSLTILKEKRDALFTSPELIFQIAKFVVGKTCTILYSTAGIIMLMIIVGSINKKREISIPKWLGEVGKLCFGVYLFQQFILQALYYNTNLPASLGPIVTPWAGFVITITSSLLLSWLCRLNRFGRSII